MKLCGFRGEKEVFEERSAAMNYQILFNPYAKSGHGANEARALDTILAGDQLTYTSMPDIRDYAAFFASIAKTDRVLIAGGDGTLNRFINDTAGLDIRHDIYYFPAGSGNDFWKDLNRTPGDAPVCINEYLKDLPKVEIQGRTYAFLNGIGYGIDGYCCEKGDEHRQKSRRRVNYTAIALRGLLGDFKPVNAAVTVDGIRRTYQRVWLAPTMHGRFFGGGMMPTPAQNRTAFPRKLSVMVAHSLTALKALSLFPTMFKGEHVRYTQVVEMMTGQDITVEFDRPTPLQVDGETVHGVTSYHAVAANGSAAAACV